MMITIGITGGVGAGKSTVLDFHEEKYQAYVMKADEIGHLVMEPGQSCYEPVIALFGRQIIKNDKTIDRRQVSDVVFSHPELLDEADMMNLAVRETVRRQGIARLLVLSLCRQLHEKGVMSLTLEVRDSNEPAIRLYSSLGFLQVGRRPNYYFHPKEDARILRKDALA